MPTTAHLLTLILAATASTATARAGGTYVEKDGIIVMEAENTNSPVNLWKRETAIPGHTGVAYLDFTGNDPESGLASSPLEYSFRITTGGLYFLHLHCSRETVTINGKERNDVANDCYVRVEGDYGTGPKPGNRHGMDAPLSLLKSDVKFFGGDAMKFAWASGNRIDPGGETNKRVAIYNFKPGERYKLVVSGRSKLFKLDRILVRHEKVEPKTAEALDLPESNQEPPDKSAAADAESRSTPGVAPAGRLAIVTDGNALDPDDVCATPVSLAMIRAMGLEKRLVHFNHSCELVNKAEYNKPNGTAEEVARRRMNQESCDGTASRWGGFEHLTFWNCRTQKDEAVADLRAAINASTAADPLWIIEAGEPDVIYEAASKADPGTMRHLRILTHHPNNDRGSFHHLDDVLALQSPGAGVIRIGDQNKNLKTPLAAWEWARNHPDPKIQWLWERGAFAANKAFVDPKFKFRAIAGKFDCSDAGMTLFWLTGAQNGGLQNGSPEDIRKILTRETR